MLANFDLFKHQLKILNYKLKLHKVKNLDDKTTGTPLKIIDIDINYKLPFKVHKKDKQSLLKFLEPSTQSCFK